MLSKRVSLLMYTTLLLASVTAIVPSHTTLDYPPHHGILWGVRQNVSFCEAVLLCLLVVGVLQDRKLYGSGMWSDERSGCTDGAVSLESPSIPSP